MTTGGLDEQAIHNHLLQLWEDAADRDLDAKMECSTNCGHFFQPATSKRSCCREPRELLESTSGKSQSQEAEELPNVGDQRKHGPRASGGKGTGVEATLMPIVLPLVAIAVVGRRVYTHMGVWV